MSAVNVPAISKIDTNTLIPRILRRDGNNDNTVAIIAVVYNSVFQREPFYPVT